MATDKTIQPVSFRLENDVKQALDDLCRVRSISLSQKLAELVKEFLAKNPLTKEEKTVLAQLAKIKEANTTPKPKKK
jgi:hypothetical protein